jgi:hypothetical protein
MALVHPRCDLDPPSSRRVLDKSKQTVVQVSSRSKDQRRSWTLAVAVAIGEGMEHFLRQFP